MKTYNMKINGQKYTAKILRYDGVNAKVQVNGMDFLVELDNDQISSAPRLVRSERSAPTVPVINAGASGYVSGDVKAPIPGIIVDIPVKVGDEVESGDVLVILEAMKMESEIVAPTTGKILEIKVGKGDSVGEGDILIVIQGKNKPVQPKQVKTSPAPKTVRPAAPVTTGAGKVTSPIPGIIVDVKVKVGDKVNTEDVMVILEAMKMESEITTSFTGTVKSVLVSKGDNVQEGQVLVEIEG